MTQPPIGYRWVKSTDLVDPKDTRYSDGARAKQALPRAFDGRGRLYESLIPHLGDDEWMRPIPLVEPFEFDIRDDWRTHEVAELVGTRVLLDGVKVSALAADPKSGRVLIHPRYEDGRTAVGWWQCMCSPGYRSRSSPRHICVQLRLGKVEVLHR